METGFFFFFRRFHLKLTVKMAVFVAVFGNGQFFGQFHETVIWLKCWNCQFGRKKLKLVAAAKPLAASFNFSPAESDSFNMLCQYHSFMKLVQSLNIFSKNGHKTVIFIRQFSRETVRNKNKKMKPVLNWNCSFRQFLPKGPFFSRPVSVQNCFFSQFLRKSPSEQFHRTGQFHWNCAKKLDSFTETVQNLEIQKSQNTP